MKVQLVTVGSKMPAWVQAGYDEYAKRLPKDLAPKLVEIPLRQRAKTSVTEAVRAEGEAVMQALPKAHVKVMLDVKGRPWSTEQLAQQMSRWQMQGVDLSFVIGGPDGLSEPCLAQADQRWSLSPLTLPHPLVRIVFIEQWYRAWTIQQNHPYHK